MEVETGQVSKNPPEFSVLRGGETRSRESRSGSADEREKTRRRHVGFLPAFGGERREIPEVVVGHHTEGGKIRNRGEADGADTAEHGMAPDRIGAE